MLSEGRAHSRVGTDGSRGGGCRVGKRRARPLPTRVRGLLALGLAHRVDPPAGTRDSKVTPGLFTLYFTDAPLLNSNNS